MSRPVKWTEAEKRSFKLVPETCDAIHHAIQNVRDCNFDLFTEVMGKYKLPPDKQAFYAFCELHSRITNKALFELQDVIHYQATFPLRLALVQKIEAEMRDAGEVVEEGHYARWIDEGRSNLERNAKTEATAANAIREQARGGE